MVRPDGEDVASALLELLAVFEAEGAHVGDALRAQDGNPSARRTSSVRSTVKGAGWRPSASTQAAGWKIWCTLWVSIERTQGRDAREIAVEPLDRAHGVFDRARHEEAGSGRAERDLAVDAEGGDPLPVLARVRDPMRGARGGAASVTSAARSTYTVPTASRS